jgi:hypothetical protein
MDGPNNALQVPCESPERGRIRRKGENLFAGRPCHEFVSMGFHPRNLSNNFVGFLGRVRADQEG